MQPTPEPAPPYPDYREADIVLRDGSTAHVRPVRPDDAPRLLAFLEGLSEESRTLRFFSPAVNLAAEAQRAAQVDYERTFGLVATVGADERIVGHALYAAGRDDRAEVAFAVADDYRGRGLATLLLGHLAEIAAAKGIRVFEAETLPTNHRMLGVFRQSGFPVEVHSGPGEIHLSFPTALDEAAIAQFERREQIAAVSALQAFLHPRGVAVIGASRQRGSVGSEVFHNLVAYEFGGPVYPVNPAASVVQCVPAYPSVEAVPGPVDLAVVAVPAAHVLEVAEACGRKGVRALVVLSAGFAETGPAGRARQAALLRACRAAGMRLIGPNCIGIGNTDPAIRLNATFGPFVPPAGRIGFSSQSGALGLAAMDYAGALGLGISSFVTVGNKADISGNDLLHYWETDPHTDVILLYLESFGNPRKFARIARRVGRTKPIVAVKSGRSTAGARATSSHTGALLAASDVPVEALFRQAGVIRTDTLEEMFGVAALLANQPLPAGRRVGIVTNVGGPAILCADTLEAQGLEVPVLAEATQARLRGFLPAEASPANPVDMLAAATADQYRQALGVVAADPGIDAVIAIFIPPLATRAEDVAHALVAAVGAVEHRKPVLAVFMGSQGVPEALRAPGVHIPSYAFPEAAAIALAHAARYGAWRARPLAVAPSLPGLRRDEAAALVARALGTGADWLGPDDVAALLGCYGLPLAPQRTVATPDAAGDAADALGGAVALKAIAPGLVHKTDAGAVRLDLRGAGAVRAAAQEMAATLTRAGQPPTGFLVQQMVPAGVEMIAGLVHDPQFGPLLACGAGGTLVELLRDVAVRLTPLTTDDAHAMVRELKTYPLLEGFRGQPPADVAALEDALLRLSALAEDRPEVAELDCNPIVVLARGACILDARIRLAPAAPPLPLGARR
ncbi:MAG TPA: GNAT family N-acetyltransferase [Chloroflexota bacterium]|nr:GNAT family N-acetyltransferase [Chloroflexota bacterium]